jgi:uncharacterized repeat protein (TIGR01451 family)
LHLSLQALRLRTVALVAVVSGLLAGFAFVASPAALAATPGTFTTLASSPNPVNNVAVDPTTNIIYAQESFGTSFYSYNPATNTWTTLASSPINQGDNGGGAYLDGKLYEAYDSSSTEIGVYDIATGTWSTLTNPLGEATGDITSAGGLIYMGEGSGFVSYDPSTAATKTLASPPSGLSSWGVLAPYDGKIYATEGDGSSGFSVYDIASNTWTTLPDVPSGAVLGGAIDPVSGTFFAYGNYGGDTFDMYNIASGTWTTTTFPGTDVDDGGMAYVPTPGLQGIYATYGQDEDGFTRYNTVAGADVSIKKTASAKHVGVGQHLTYTLSVKNTGGSTADDVTAADKLPSDVKFHKDSTSAGRCSGKTTVTCSLGTVNAGRSVKVKITVTAKRKGKSKNTGTVSTSSFNLSTDTSSSVTVKIVGKPLKLSVTPHTAAAGVKTCYAFTGTSGGKAVGGAKVTLGGHSATTSSHGTASLCLSLKKGTYHPRISKSGYIAATAAIRVTAAPAFTG